MNLTNFAKHFFTDRPKKASSFFFLSRKSFILTEVWSTLVLMLFMLWWLKEALAGKWYMLPVDIGSLAAYKFYPWDLWDIFSSQVLCTSGLFKLLFLIQKFGRCKFALVALSTWYTYPIKYRHLLSFILSECPNHDIKINKFKQTM